MKYENRIIIWSCALIFLGCVYLLFYKFYHFGFYDWDLAFFNQACWQMIHGQTYVPLFGINYFADHAYFITFLILPFYSLFPHALTLLVFKAASFSLACYFFIQLFKSRLPLGWVLIGVGLYLIFPSNIFSVLYEFNPECFAPPLLFWMFLSLNNRRWRQMWVAAFLLMMLKENMHFIVIMLSVFAWFKVKGNERNQFIWLALIAAVIFYLFSFHVVPYFQHVKTHAYMVRYEFLGHNFTEICQNILANPNLIIEQFFTKENGILVGKLFGPMWPFALLSPHYLLGMLPILMQHLLSLHPPEHSIYYHYGMTIAVFVFLAGMNSIAFIYHRVNRFLFILLMACLLAASILNLKGYKNDISIRINHHKTNSLINCYWDSVLSIPPSAGVISTFDFLSMLSSRSNIYSFHKIYDNSYQDPVSISSSVLSMLKPFTLPESVQYALIDFQDMWLQRSIRSGNKECINRINAFFANDDWKVVKRCGSVVLFKR